MVRRAEIAACPACNAAALHALDAWVELSRSQADYSLRRRDAAEERAWLTEHAGGDVKAYLEMMYSYVRTFYELPIWATRLAAARQVFDNAMRDLADCNARLCKDTYKEVVVSGRNLEEAAAYCPACELDAAKYNRSLAHLLFLDAFIADLTAQRSKLLQINRTRSWTDKELDSIADLDAMIKRQEEGRTDTLRELGILRADLDACNKAYPAESCKTPATVGKDIFPGSTTIQPLGGGTGIPGGINLGPNPKISVGEAGAAPSTTPQDSGGAPPSKVPVPGGPAEKPSADQGAPPPPGNALQPEAVSTPGRNDFTLAPATPGFHLRVDEEADDEYLTFVVPFDDAHLRSVLALPFFKNKVREVIPLEGGAHQVTIDAGDNPLAESYLRSLATQGLLNSVEWVACWGWEPDPAAARRSSAPATVLYTPVSPSPAFNPGERPGDEQPPTIGRAGSDGAVGAPPVGLAGPVEIRVAKGCAERTTTAVAGGPDRVPLARLAPFVARPNSAAFAGRPYEPYASQDPLPKPSRIAPWDIAIRNW
jgi:hypothetical protein